jgi:hypothetical protein
MSFRPIPRRKSGDLAIYFRIVWHTGLGRSYSRFDWRITMSDGGASARLPCERWMEFYGISDADTD